MTPSISLVAYEARNPAFVVPNERGRYLRTDASVITSVCELCKATVGEPCRRHYGVGISYHSGTHATRRDAHKRKFGLNLTRDRLDKLALSVEGTEAPSKDTFPPIFGIDILEPEAA